MKVKRTKGDQMPRRPDAQEKQAGLGTWGPWRRVALPRLLVACCLSLAVLTSTAHAQAWTDVKGKHFIVSYLSRNDLATAKQILQRAEDYYSKIGDRIGFTRYGDFWTWDDRTQVFLYPDQASFVDGTGQPTWSTGFSDRDPYLFQSRVIATFNQEREFFDGLLPHEISHLVLHDYIPERLIPIWFDEGIAQLFEHHKSAQARRIMRAMVTRGKYIPLRQLMSLDIRGETDPKRVTIFYAQSLSVVEFLLDHYGQDAFRRLCRSMRDGDGFETALRKATSNQLPSLEALEEKWFNDLHN